MIRIAILFGALATSAAAQTWEPQHPEDSWTLEYDGGDRATLQFYNADPPASGGFPAELTEDGLTVHLHVEISQGPEIMTVTPPEGWIAVPPVISVVDGETGIVELYRGEFLGM